MDKTKVLKVLLVDDHPVVREGLRIMLGTAPNIEVVAEANDGFEAIEKANEHQPDVVLMDLRMPNLDGLEATRRIKRQLPATSVIVLTVYDNNAYIVDAVRAGAGAYLLKDTSKDLLIHTIRAVSSGATLIKTNLLYEAMSSLVASKNGSQKSGVSTIEGLEALTRREQEVLKLVAAGRTNKGIGKELSIAEYTVKKHMQSIIAKLNASGRTEAAMKATRAGIIK